MTPEIDCPQSANPASSAEPAADLGTLPEWSLDDLYPGLESQAVRDAFAEAARRAKEFKQAYQGRLAAMAGGGGDDLGQAVTDYEAIEELIGRIMS